MNMWTASLRAAMHAVSHAC